MAKQETHEIISKAKESGKISKREIDLLMMRKNKGEKIDFDVFWDNEIELTDYKQGLDWLKNLWKTETGKERKGNPFGYREQLVISDFKYFRFKGEYDAGNFFRAYYVPLWEVVAECGQSFEYYMSGGKINIVG